MNLRRMFALITAAFLSGSAVSSEQESAPTLPVVEEKRYVRVSLREGYEDVVTNFKVADKILPLSLARFYRNTHQKPDMIVDVCEFRMALDGVYEITVCEPHGPQGRQ